MLVEEHGWSQDIAIYISILAPTLIALGPMMTIRYCDRHRDFIKGGVVFLLGVTPIPLILAFLYGKSAIFTFVLSVIYIVCVNGVKSIALSVMAFKLKDVINTAEYSAICNATASLAGGIAPTIIGKIIDEYGWSTSYFAVFGVTLAAVIVLIIVDMAVIKNNKRKENYTF
jgi:MFS family permease